MIAHWIESSEINDEAAPRDSIGGRPIVPAGWKWPSCDCGEHMVLFFQFDVRGEFGLPFEQGSHLSVFMCPQHNDAPVKFDEEELPERFWERRKMFRRKPVRFYELILQRPGSRETIHPPDPFLVPHRLRFSPRDDGDEPVLTPKVGGRPSWLQDTEVFRCCCGSAMRFLCQTPVDWPFAKRPEAPEQPQSFSSDDYCLFLGNATYLFACEARCDPRAVLAVAQN